MAKSKSVASRGFVNDTILECLMAGDKYGYEIIKEVEKKSNGKVVLKQPSLYSSLRRFEAKGYISSYWGDSDIGGRRHYYSITESGRQYFNLKNRSDDEDDEKEEALSDEEEIEEKEEEQSPPPLKKEDSYELDKGIDIDEEIPVVSDSYVSSFKNFSLEDKVNELIGEESSEQSINQNIKQPFNLYNTVHKKEEDVEYIKEQEDAKEQEEPIEELPESESKFYVKDEEILKNVDVKETSPSLSGTEFVKEGFFQQVISVPANQPGESKTSDDVNLSEESEKESVTAINKTIPIITEEEDVNLDELRKKALQNTESFSKTEFSESPLKQELDKKRAEKYHQEDMFNAPVKKQYNVITDEDGIKKAASDAVSSRREQKIFDNVGVRVSPQKSYIPLGSEETNKEETKTIDDFEDIINDDFTDAGKEEKDEVEEAKEINYKQILGDLYESDSEKKSEHRIINNPFEKPVIQEESQEFKPSQKVEQKITENLEEVVIRSYLPSNNKEREYDFILYNKARATLAFFLTMFALIQISTFFIILKAKGTLSATDSAIFITGLCLAGAALIGFVAPWFLKPGRRKLQKFNFKLNLLLCSLAFLAISIVIYAINSFLGLEAGNISKHISTLLLPIILSFNIVLAPIIYKLITIKKDMY